MTNDKPTGEKPGQKYTEADAGDGTRREDQYLHGVKLIVCLASLFLNMFLVGLDQTIVATIVTDVANQFNSFNKIGWLTSGFLLPMTVLSANWGQLSILFGRKYVILVSLLIFEAGSLMCALSQNMNTLIGGRVLGGIGASGIQSNIFIVVSEVVDMHYRPVAFACFGAVMGISLSVGPLVGGALTSNATWRWCFYINLPIGGLAAILFFLVFNPPRPKIILKEQLKKIDYIGVFLLAAGLTVFLVGLTFASTGEYAWKSSAFILCVILGVIVTIIFGIWNWKFSPHRLIPIEVAMVPQITACGISILGMFASFTAIVLYLSVYFQNICGRDALHTGLSLLPVIVPMAIASISGGIAISKSSIVKPFAMVGTTFIIVGAGLLTLLEVNISVGKNIGLLILSGFGNGLVMQSIMASSNLTAPKTPGALIMTTSYVMLLRNLGGTLGGILAELTYNTSLKNKLSKALVDLPTTNPELYKDLSHFTVDELSASTAILNTLSPDALYFIRSYMMKSIKNVFYLCIGLAAISFIAAIFTSNKKVPRKKDIKTKEDRDAEDNKEDHENYESNENNETNGNNETNENNENTDNGDSIKTTTEIGYNNDNKV